MKKYTVILDDGYYMIIEADVVRGPRRGRVTFFKQGREIAHVNSPRAVVEVDGTEPDGYWFRHL